MEKKANRATSERKTIELCEFVCVVESKYFKSIIVISVGVGFFCSFILFIFLSSFIFECYLKSVFYFSCDFLLNLSQCGTQWHMYGDVDLSLIVSFRVFYSFFIEVIFNVVGFVSLFAGDDLWTFICRAFRINSPVAHFV